MKKFNLLSRKQTLPIESILEPYILMLKKSRVNILVVGSGGREHALVKKCLQSPMAGRVIAAPGNGGIAAEVQCFEISIENVTGLVALAIQCAINLVIIGPEIPLSLGIVDALTEAGITAYGPNQAGAQLESSKTFCKEFFARHNIPTAHFDTFTEVAPALTYLKKNPAPIVIKVSGLAAGKGVIMAETQEEAIAAVKDILQGQSFGRSGKEIVIEETLYGEEVSIHVIASAQNFVCLPPSQDHKRCGEGDTGLNTGGMGAYTPTSKVTPEIQFEIEEKIIKPTLAGLRADGIEYRGTLYAGLMITKEGVKILEYNVRFGDPETQVLLPMLNEDIVPLFLASANGESLPNKLKTHEGAAIAVVLAADGYPGHYDSGSIIQIPDSLPSNCSVIHAGTTRDKDGTIRTAGGRVLSICGQAYKLQTAAEIAYTACDQIKFENKYLRRDIGQKEIRRN